MSHNLLEDLDGSLELSQNLEKTVENALSFFLNFDRETKFEKRIQHELRLIFQEKKSNKTYFAPPPNQNKLKALGFNQMIHLLIKRLWDEEDFVLYSKIPKEISFLENEATDLKLAKVSLDDSLRYVKNLRVLPFVTPEGDFFARKRGEQIRLCVSYLQKGNSLQNFLSRLKLIGTFPQVVFYAGQNLILLANDYAENPDMQFTDEVPTGERITEDKASILTKVILSHPLVQQGYFKFSEQTLKRTIFNDAEELLNKKPNLKYFYEMLNKSKSSGLKLTEEQIVKAAARIINEYQKALAEPTEEKTPEPIKEKKEQILEEKRINPSANPNPSQTSANPAVNPNANANGLQRVPKRSYIDLAHAYDRLVYDLKNALKSLNTTISIHSILKNITTNVKETYPSIQENHLTLIFLYLKDLERKPHTVLEGVGFFKTFSEKFKVAYIDAYMLYFLLRSDKEEEFSKISLGDFVEDCIQNDKGGALSEKQINILRSLFLSLPKEVSINHFYQVKEKLKAKVDDDVKKRIIESLAEYIHVRIAEKKGNWALRQLKENHLV